MASLIFQLLNESEHYPMLAHNFTAYFVEWAMTVLIPMGIP